MTKRNKLINGQIMELLDKCINLGLERAAKVIGELVDSDVKLTSTNMHLADNTTEISLYSKRIVVQEMISDSLRGKTIFSMGDDELIKLIKYLEGFDEIDIEHEESLELLMDTYHEIGNIILGNIISSMVDFLNLRVEIKVPYLTTENIFDASDDMQLIIVDVLFKINKLDIEGRLFLVNDYNAYLNLLELENK